MKERLLSTQAPAGHSSEPVPKKGNFHRELLQCLPDLRGFARFLTRDTSAADDLVQETIVRALAAQTQFQEGSVLKAWLFTIQRHAFYEQNRRRSRELEIMQDIEFDAPASDAMPLRQHDRDALQDLGEMLWKLPHPLREALILVGAQELSYEDAARVCDVPSGTMRARVSRARAQLAELSGRENTEIQPEPEKKIA